MPLYDDEIRAAFHRINIVDLMVTRLNALPQPTRQVLDGRLDASDLADQLAHKAGLLG